jgi:N-acyl amino acid synthase of PEP-CTERM/exosortase system
MERDEFDTHSACSLLIHRRTGVIAGGIRLILPFEDDAPRELPLWHVCNRHALEAYSRSCPRERTGEVSRDAISKQFRRMVVNLGESGGESLYRVMRNLSLGLMTAVVRMAKEHGITHICAAMEAALLRMFARLGIHLQKLGPPIEFHGVRQPAYADLDALLVRTWIERPDVWSLITSAGQDWPLNRTLAHSIAKHSGVRLAL